MKMMDKLTCFVLAAAFLTGAVYAQTIPDASEVVVLPDVSSSLENIEIVIDPDAVPDFSLVLPLDGVPLPVIRDLDVFAADFGTTDPAPAEETSRAVFMEAVLGLGFRSSFSGDFSVYRSTGSIPFSLDFSHETVNGFGRHTASEGYKQSETRIQGDGSFSISDNLSFSVAASYFSGAFGLQEKSIAFSDIDRESLSFDGLLSYRLTPSVSVTGALHFLSDVQFATLSPALSLTPEDRSAAVRASRSSGVWCDPTVGLTVQGKNLTASLTGSYSTGTSQNRTRADLSLEYNWNDTVDASLAAGVVIATNGLTQTVYPFSFRAATGSTVPFTLSLEGGLKSEKTDFTALEQQYPFIMMNDVRQREESAWFGNLAFQTTVLNYGYVTAGASFEKTAFGNSCQLPLYGSAKTDQGLYQLSLRDTTEFNTSFGLALPFEYAAVSADWNAAWFDNLSPLPSDRISIGISCISGSGLLGAETSCLIALTDATLPCWDISAFYRLSDAVKLELSGSDLLCFSSDRSTFGDYISRGGYVTLSAHVYF